MSSRLSSRRRSRSPLSRIPLSAGPPFSAEANESYLLSRGSLADPEMHSTGYVPSPDTTPNSARPNGPRFRSDLPMRSGLARDISPRRSLRPSLRPLCSRDLTFAFPSRCDDVPSGPNVAARRSRTGPGSDFSRLHHSDPSPRTVPNDVRSRPLFPERRSHISSNEALLHHSSTASFSRIDSNNPSFRPYRSNRRSRTDHNDAPSRPFNHDSRPRLVPGGVSCNDRVLHLSFHNTECPHGFTCSTRNCPTLCSLHGVPGHCLVHCPQSHALSVYI